MLAAMRERSFVVTIAYTKTEPVQVALFAVVFLGEHRQPRARRRDPHRHRRRPPPVLAVAQPAARCSRGARRSSASSPAALFALSAIGFRGGIVALDTPGFRRRRRRSRWPSR